MIKNHIVQHGVSELEMIASMLRSFHWTCCHWSRCLHPVLYLMWQDQCSAVGHWQMGNQIKKAYSRLMTSEKKNKQRSQHVSNLDFETHVFIFYKIKALSVGHHLWFPNSPKARVLWDFSMNTELSSETENHFFVSNQRHRCQHKRPAWQDKRLQMTSLQNKLWWKQKILLRRSRE